MFYVLFVYLIKPKPFQETSSQLLFFGSHNKPRTWLLGSRISLELGIKYRALNRKFDQGFTPLLSTPDSKPQCVSTIMTQVINVTVQNENVCVKSHDSSHSVAVSSLGY